MREGREARLAVSRFRIDDRTGLVVVRVPSDGVAAVDHREGVDQFLRRSVAAVGAGACRARCRGDAPVVGVDQIGEDTFGDAVDRTDLRVEVVHVCVGIRAVGADEAVDAHIDHVLRRAGGRLPLLFIVNGRKERIAELVDHVFVEVVAVEEFTGRIEQHPRADCQCGTFGGAAIIGRFARPYFRQPFARFVEFVRYVVDALLPCVAFAFVQPLLREVDRIVADEKNGSVGGHQLRIVVGAQKAGFVIVVVLVDIRHFGAFEDMLHEVVGLADAFVEVVVGTCAVEIVARTPRVVVDERVVAAGEYDRSVVVAARPRQSLAARVAVIGLVAVNIGQILFRSFRFLEDLRRSQRFVGLPVEVVVAGGECDAGDQDRPEYFQYAFHGHCRLV